MPNASGTRTGSPMISPRPASRIGVSGFTSATASTQSREERPRRVDRQREHEDQHRGLQERRRLDRLRAEDEADRPERDRECEEQHERGQPEQLEDAAVDLHPGGDSDDGEQDARDDRADDAGDRVADEDRCPVARSRAACGGRTSCRSRRRGTSPSAMRRHRQADHQHPDELEGRVVGVAEGRNRAEPRHAAREGREQEEREDERRQRERGALERANQLAPREAEGAEREASRSSRHRHRAQRARGQDAARWRASRPRRARRGGAPARPSRRRAGCAAPRSGTRPGCTSRSVWNQSVWISSRGRPTDEKKSAAMKSGKTACTASLERVTSATVSPSAPNATENRAARPTISDRSGRSRPRPALRRRGRSAGRSAPGRRRRARRPRAARAAGPTPRIGVSVIRRTKPVLTSSPSCDAGDGDRVDAAVGERQGEPEGDVGLGREARQRRGEVEPADVEARR